MSPNSFCSTATISTCPMTLSIGSTASDAFHHVPNQTEVIREFGRVLRTGRYCGFSEPGRRHSSSPQSQYEMQNHKVLENDIDVNEIFACAQTVGFSRLSLRVATDMEMSIEEHDTLFAPPHGDAHERLKARVVESDLQHDDESCRVLPPQGAARAG